MRKLARLLAYIAATVVGFLLSGLLLVLAMWANGGARLHELLKLVLLLGPIIGAVGLVRLIFQRRDDEADRQAAVTRMTGMP